MCNEALINPIIRTTTRLIIGVITLHVTFGARKLLRTYTRHIWCQEVVTDLYTSHLVSGSGYGLIHVTFDVGKWLRTYTRHIWCQKVVTDLYTLQF
jgi:hypothetical protein